MSQWGQINGREHSKTSGMLKMFDHTIKVNMGAKMSTLSDLTPRELEVLQLLLAGKTNKEIAQQIAISAKTVEFHLDHIYTKLGVRSRMLAGVWAMQQGLEIEPREIPS